jgi:hypothetical protein
VDAVITEDSDLLAYGVERVFFKMQKDGSGEQIQRKRLPETTELAFHYFSDEMFLAMCILAGCDYLPSIAGMGIKRAHEFVRKGKTTEKTLSMVRFTCGSKVPDAYVDDFQRARMTFCHQRVFDPREQRLVSLTPLPGGLAEDLVNLDFLGPWMTHERAAAIANGRLDPHTDRPYLELPILPQSFTGTAWKAHGFTSQKKTTDSPVTLFSCPTKRAPASTTPAPSRPSAAAPVPQSQARKSFGLASHVAATPLTKFLQRTSSDPAARPGATTRVQAMYTPPTIVKERTEVASATPAPSMSVVKASPHSRFFSFTKPAPVASEGPPAVSTSSHAQLDVPAVAPNKPSHRPSLADSLAGYAFSSTQFVTESGTQVLQIHQPDTSASPDTGSELLYGASRAPSSTRMSSNLRRVASGPGVVSPSLSALRGGARTTQLGAGSHTVSLDFEQFRRRPNAPTPSNDQAISRLTEPVPSLAHVETTPLGAASIFNHKRGRDVSSPALPIRNTKLRLGHSPVCARVSELQAKAIPSKVDADRSPVCAKLSELQSYGIPSGVDADRVLYGAPASPTFDDDCSHIASHAYDPPAAIPSTGFFPFSSAANAIRDGNLQPTPWNSRIDFSPT